MKIFISTHREFQKILEIAPPNPWIKGPHRLARWRAPGAAPVFDSCGMAGGHKPPQGSFGGIYVNTSHAKLGDKGSEVLPKAPSGTIWTAGTAVEVSWTIEANQCVINYSKVCIAMSRLYLTQSCLHCLSGGGYQYRLAPAGSPLTEETFRKMPLAFVGQQGLRWGVR